MTAVAVFFPADIRFPSPRANGIQVVKTAHALAEAGIDVELAVRRTALETPEGPELDRKMIEADCASALRGYGLAPHSGLRILRLGVLHKPGRHAIPRALFLARAIARALRSPARPVFTRDLQLADALIRIGHAGVVYEAHAVEAVMFDERAALYGTGERRDARKRARIAAREERVYRGAAGFVATTAGILEWFARAHGERSAAVAIPNGCDVPAKRSFRSPPPGETIVYAGQLYPWKGVDVLVRAFASLPTERMGARLLIAGGIAGEPDLDRVRQLVSASGVAERVTLLGHRPQSQVASILETANVVAVPFLKTAMTAEHTSPIKAFEAMAVGRALLISDTRASREIVTDGVEGLLIAPGDEAAWSGALARVLGDRDEQFRLARGAFDAAPRFSWARRAEKLRELFASLRGSGPSTVNSVTKSTGPAA